MGKFCSNCGAELKENENFCSNCGKASDVSTASRVLISKRDIAVSVILSLITCGLYGLYWFIMMTDESNELVTENKTASGVLAIVYTLITCGIYSIYWHYKMGKKMTEAGQKYGKVINDNSVLYLVLALFGLGIVNNCLIQNDLNSLAE